MTLLTLFAGERGLVASERLVYGPDEFGHLERVQATADELDGLLAGERDRIDAAVAAAETRGRADGAQRGERAATERLVGRLLELQREFDAATLRRRDDVVEIALEVVRRVAGEVGPERWLAALARRAAEELVEREPAGLRVHPDRVEGVGAELGGAPFDDVVGDESLGPDECWIESPFGRVDVSLETQLRRVLALAGDGTSAGAESRAGVRADADAVRGSAS